MIRVEPKQSHQWRFDAIACVSWQVVLVEPEAQKTNVPPMQHLRRSNGRATESDDRSSDGRRPGEAFGSLDHLK